MGGGLRVLATTSGERGRAGYGLPRVRHGSADRDGINCALLPRE
jgi:hypothetical protein